ncbi:MAG: exonuclease SbcCD subunit D [Candidatus Aenigmatarchaeota archaeon]
MVKVAIISDLHLGFGKGTEREEDPFVAAERAFETAKDRGADLVVLAGDMFDTRLPRPEHWSRFMKLLSIFRDGKNAEVVKVEGRDEIPEQCLEGIPVIAIHGTHERRGKGMKNTVEALEDAGFIVHLHCASMELEIGGEKIGIHGMSGVPEKYSKEVLEKWNPEPFPDAYNIFTLHQDLDPYIFNPANPPSLGLEDLPEDFDLYVSGHIHWKDKQELKGGLFMIPGSLVPTQLREREAKMKKGFYILDTEKEETEFIGIRPPREFFYEDMEFEGKGPEEIEKRVESRLEDTLSGSFGMKPLVRVKIKGELPKGVSSNDVDLSRLKKKYGEDALLTFSVDLQEKGLEEKVETLRNLREEKLSVDEMGMKILREKTEETGASVDPDLVFEDLVEGDLEDAMQKLEEAKNGSYEEGDEDAEEDGEDEREGKEDEGVAEEEGQTEEWWK